MGQNQTRSYVERAEKQLKIVMRNRKADGRKKDFSMTTKDLEQLFEQVSLEYPWFDSIHESAIITDHKLPDEPIIFCNEEFTALTGYPKEDILGRNCRFLQGKHTDPKHVQSIRDALKVGDKLEIQLLNYRRDGTPFLNGFLMLPLHKGGKKTGPVSNYLAVQKNVTVIVSPWRAPMAQWTVPEVCMWLEKNEAASYVRMFMQKDVSGKVLESMTMDSLTELGVALSSEKERIYRLITQEKAGKKQKKLLHPSATTEFTETSEDLSRLVQLMDSSVEASSEGGSGHHARTPKQARPSETGSSSASKHGTARKAMLNCSFPDAVRPSISILGSPAISLSALKKLLRKKTGRNYNVLSMVSPDGMAKALQVEIEPTLDGLEPAYFQLMEGLPMPCLVTDNVGLVCASNERLWEDMELTSDPIDQYAPSLIKCPFSKLTYVSDLRQRSFPVERDGASWNCTINEVQIAKARLYVWLLTPVD